MDSRPSSSLPVFQRLDAMDRLNPKVVLEPVVKVVLDEQHILADIVALPQQTGPRLCKTASAVDQSQLQFDRYLHLGLKGPPGGLGMLNTKRCGLSVCPSKRSKEAGARSSHRASPIPRQSRPSAGSGQIKSALAEEDIAP